MFFIGGIVIVDRVVDIFIAIVEVVVFIVIILCVYSSA